MSRHTKRGYCIGRVCVCVSVCVSAARYHAIINKAIRDGMWLGNVHPIKIENFDFFFVTSFHCSLKFLYY